MSHNDRSGRSHWQVDLTEDRTERAAACASRHYSSDHGARLVLAGRGGGFVAASVLRASFVATQAKRQLIALRNTEERRSGSGPTGWRASRLALAPLGSSGPAMGDPG
jgi:hypothetical protein